MKTVDAVCPTLIYHRRTLAVAAPTLWHEVTSDTPALGTLFQPPARTETWVKHVVLRKRDAPELGLVYSRPASKGFALFEDLSIGEFDVYYLQDDGIDIESWDASDFDRFGPAHRRIIIADEIESTKSANGGSKRAGADDNQIAPAADAKGIYRTPLSPVVGAEQQSGATTAKQRFLAQVNDRATLGWGLLRSEDVQAALGEFRQAIREWVAHCRNSNILPAPIRLQRYSIDSLDAGSPDVLHALRTGKIEHHLLAYGQACAVGNEKQLAHAFYGLGKTYDAAARSVGQNAMDGAAELAVVLYLTAVMLDDELREAQNDLGVLYYRLGRTDAAFASLLRAASSGQNAVIASNLGLFLWERGETRQAKRWWARAISWQPFCDVAILAQARSALLETAQPVRPQECRALAADLSRVIDLFGRDSEEGEWATSVLRNLGFLSEESQMNRSRITLRILLPDAPSRWETADSRAGSAIPRSMNQPPGESQPLHQFDDSTNQSQPGMPSEPTPILRIVHQRPSASATYDEIAQNDRNVIRIPESAFIPDPQQEEEEGWRAARPCMR